MSDDRPIPQAIWERAREYWEDRDIFTWWRSEQKLLGGKRTCDASDEEVVRLLNQLDSGAYL